MTRHTVLLKGNGRPHEASFFAGNEFIAERSRVFSSSRIPASAVRTKELYITVFNATKKRRYLSSIMDCSAIVPTDPSSRVAKFLSEFEVSPLRDDFWLRSIGIFIVSHAEQLYNEGVRIEALGDKRYLRLYASEAILRQLLEVSPVTIKEALTVIFDRLPSEQLARFIAHYGRAFAEEIGIVAKSEDASEAEAPTSEAPTSEAPTSEAPTSEAPMSEETHEVDNVEVAPALDGETWINGVLIKDRDLAIFDTMLQFDENETANILMIGPSGCGKTSIPTAYAKHAGLNVIRVNCAAVRDPEEWFGYREAVNGSTVFVPTEFTESVRKGNVIVILDEFNRLEPWLHNTLLPLLDHARETVVHGERIKCGPHTIFVATMNIGARFTGTFVLDSAILNRFDAVINVSYLSRENEIKLLVERTDIAKDDAAKIVDVMEKFRKHDDVISYGLDVSTRSSLKIAKLVAHGTRGIDIRTAIGYVIMNAIDDSGLLKSLSDLVISTL